MNKTCLEQLDLKDIKIDDAFWNKHIRLVREKIIPYQWEAINTKIPDADPSYAIKNFRIAAGLEKGELRGAVFQDTDVAKWLEAVGFSLAGNRSEELEKLADETIDLIGMAQQPDGYINTYFTVKAPEERWKNLTEGHELYTAGHMIEAAVAYYNSTGKKKFLDIVCKFADLICQVFGNGEGQIHGYPGHQEIELALIKLYHTTGERKYLEEAKYFIDARGYEPNYFLEERKKKDHKLIFKEFVNYSPAYSQSHLPVREQQTAEGHAVRAVYMYCAMADLAYEYQDEELFKACERLWNNIVRKRMYITGSIGSSGVWERFTVDYDLPNDRNYSETCASIGLALFGIRMMRITRDSKYIDIVERALYNTVLSGIALDGQSFFYVNPLEVWPANCIDNTSMEHVKPVRQKWFGVACCPPNVNRTLASLGQYIYAKDQDSLYLNLYISGETDVEFQEENFHISISTQFPFDEKVKIQVQCSNPMEKRFAVRIPDYARSFNLKINGHPADYELIKGYLCVKRIWSNDTVELMLSFSPQYVRANLKVPFDCGKVCITYGPLVYALEEIDNGPDLSQIYLDTNAEIQKEKTDLFGGIEILSGKGWRLENREYTDDALYSTQHPFMNQIKWKAIPYAYWNNRKKGEMAVWIKERL